MSITAKIPKDYSSTKRVNEISDQEIKSYLKSVKPTTVLQARYELGLSLSSPAAGAKIKKAAVAIGHVFLDSKNMTSTPKHKPAKPVIPGYAGFVLINVPVAAVVDLFKALKGIRETVAAYGLDDASESASRIRRIIYSAIHDDGLDVDYEHSRDSIVCRTDEECIDALYVTADMADAAKLLRFTGLTEQVSKRFKRLVAITPSLSHVNVASPEVQALKQITKEAILTLANDMGYSKEEIAEAFGIAEWIVAEVLATK